MPNFTLPGGVITIATDDMVNDVITSVLTVTSFAGFDGSVLSCTDAFVIDGDVQEATATVFSK
jgi:hypothetical protein